MAKNNRKQAREMASAGATAKEIRKETGLKASAARNVIRNTEQRAARAASPAAATAPSTPSTPKPTTPEVKGLSQGMRIAGGGGGISSQELFGKDGLGGTTKKGPDQIIRQLDKINAKLSEKDKTGISLKSGAYNKLARKVSKLNPFERGMLDFGTGRMGLQIKSMLGDPGSLGVMRQGQRVGARDAVETTFLAKGDDIGPKGKIQNRGIGKQYEVPKRFLGDDGGEKTKIISKEENPPTTESWTSAPTEGDTEPVAPEETVDNSLSSGAGGLDLASWATGFRTARSSRRRAGKGSQGLGSMKKSPFTSWYK